MYIYVYAVGSMRKRLFWNMCVCENYYDLLQTIEAQIGNDYVDGKLICNFHSVKGVVYDFLICE